MPNIELSRANRRFVQPEADRNNFYNVTGSEDDDIIELYNGSVEARAGNDVIRGLSPNGGSLQVAYWNSPKGVRVNLAEGWAEDGFGTRDTIVGATRVVGSQYDDIVWGTAGDDFFYGQAGRDYFDGGGGEDGIHLAGFRDAAGNFRGPLLSELVIEASPDGRSFVVKDPTGTGNFFQYTLRDVEYIVGDISPGVGGRLDLIKLLKADLVAQQVLVAGAAFRWNPDQPAGTPLELTFSFMRDQSSGGVRAFTAAEQDVARQMLASLAEFTLLTFREVEESGDRVGQIRFGVTAQASTKGYTVMPGISPADGAAGDIFMDVESMLDLGSGGQGREALLHEIGHALGLRHLVNSSPQDKWSIEAPARYNSTKHTVMAPTDEGLGLSRSNWGSLDVAALRYLYGTRPVQASDSVILMSDQMGLSLWTLVDDGGHDVLDCTALSVGVSIDLTPGGIGDVGLGPRGLRAFGNFSISSATMIEDVLATDLDDVLVGNTSNNTFRPFSGNDFIDGGGGWDQVILSAPASSFRLGFDGVQFTLAARDGRAGFKTMSAVEALVFSDRRIEVVSKSHGGFSELPASMYQFFILAFGAAPGVEYLQQCADAYRAGADVKRITNVFCSKSQFTDIYPTSLSNRELATKLVNNVVGTSATQAAKDEAINDIAGALNNGLGVGDMIFTVFSNLAAKTGDAKWGGTAQLFFNQIAVAKYYTEVLNQNTTDRATLASAIAMVKAESDVSNEAAIVTLIGQGLLGG